VGVRQKCRANAFSLVAALFWLPVLQPDRNMQVHAVRAVPPPRNARLKCTVTTRQTPADQHVSNLLIGHLQICRAPHVPAMTD
jgi:hypothetical protein